MYGTRFFYKKPTNHSYETFEAHFGPTFRKKKFHLRNFQAEIPKSIHQLKIKSNAKITQLPHTYTLEIYSGIENTWLSGNIDL